MKLTFYMKTLYDNGAIFTNFWDIRFARKLGQINKDNIISSVEIDTETGKITVNGYTKPKEVKSIA